MHKVLAAEPRVKLDYVALVEPARLQPIDLITQGSVALVAVRVGAVRLIDNAVLRTARGDEDPRRPGSL
jgi:pantothenate synthetase